MLEISSNMINAEEIIIEIRIGHSVSQIFEGKRIEGCFFWNTMMSDVIAKEGCSISEMKMYDKAKIEGLSKGEPLVAWPIENKEEPDYSQMDKVDLHKEFDMEIRWLARYGGEHRPATAKVYRKVSKIAAALAEKY